VLLRERQQSETPGTPTVGDRISSKFTEDQKKILAGMDPPAADALGSLDPGDGVSQSVKANAQARAREAKAAGIDPGAAKK